MSAPVLFTITKELHPSVVASLKMAEIPPHFLISALSTLSALTTDTWKTSLRFGGYTTAKNIITAPMTIETIKLLRDVLSRIHYSRGGDAPCVHVGDIEGFPAMTRFLEKTVTFLESFGAATFETEKELCKALDAFFRERIPETLGDIFSVIKGEQDSYTVVMSNPVLSVLQCEINIERNAAKRAMA